MDPQARRFMWDVIARIKGGATTAATSSSAHASGGGSGKGWFQILAVVAVLTMVGGNVMALAQKSVKRMLAYSSITHAGYLLLGVAVGAFGATRAEAVSSVLYYLAVYAATSVGAFAVVGALEARGGNVIDDDGRYDGLAQREPALALSMADFVLSLAGIPPAAGFTAKLFVFRAELEAHQVGLAVIGLLSSVVGLYYYLRVLVLMYMKPSQANAAAVPPRLAMTRLGLVVAAVLLLVVGLLPGSVLGLAQAAAAAFTS
jgi:NADH-quinone oxidoreductase subunit N